MKYVLSLRNLVQSLTRKTRRGRKPVRQAQLCRFTPRMEELEALTMPSMVTWTNPLGGLWTTPTNWSTNQVPSADDDVVINMPGITVTQAQGTMRSLALNARLLELDAASVIDGEFRFTGGTLRGAGDLTINGLFHWNGGAMEGPGQTTANGGIEVPQYHNPNNGLYGRVLNNTSAANWYGGGSLEMHNGATFNNRAGATFTVHNSLTVRLDSYEQIVSTFNNQGTFRANGTGEVTFTNNLASRAAVFNNTGRLEIAAGALTLRGGGANAGVIDLGSNALLNLADGTYSYNSGTQITGSGRLSVWGATVVNVNATVQVGRVELSSGRIGGSGTLTVTNTLSWMGGALSGGWGRTEVAAGARLEISGPVRKDLANYRLVNGGTVVWTGTGNIVFGQDGYLDNQGAFNIQTDASMTTLAAGTTFRNLGQVVKGQSNGLTRIDTQFFNYGGTTVQTGTLRIKEGSSSGSFVVNGTLDFALTMNTAYALANVAGSGTVIFSGSAVIMTGAYSGSGTVIFAGANVEMHNLYNGTGTLRIDGGRVVFERDVLSRQVVISGGEIAFRGLLVISGMFDWTGGDIQARSQVQANGGMNLGGTSTLIFRDGTLVNGGLATWTGSEIQFTNNAVFVNRANATFDAQIDSLMSFGGNAGMFQNYGTLRKTAGTIYLTVFYGTMYNVGTIEVQTGWLGVFGWTYQEGAITVGADTGLVVDSLIFSTNGQLTGAGDVWMYGAANRVVGTYDLAGNTYNLGALTVAGAMRTGLMTNTGVTYVESAGVLTATFGYEQYLDGYTYLAGGTITAQGPVNIWSGRLSGWGTINGNVMNAGQFVVGDLGFTGVLAINGDYTQTSTGMLDLEIGGTQPGTEYDQLRISGRAMLDGTLNILILNEFRCGVGDNFQILTYGTRTNEFAQINGVELGSGLRFYPVYGIDSLTLETLRA